MQAEESFSWSVFDVSCGFLTTQSWYSVAITYPQHVVHQRTSARPDLDEFYAFRFALGHPFSHEPNADELPKDLRNFWRSDEVTALPELVSTLLNGACVVTTYICSEAHAHEACQRDGAGHLNHGCQLSVPRLYPCLRALRGTIQTLMASVSCFASGVVHCLCSSRLAAVVDRLCCRRLGRLEQRTCGDAGLTVRRKLRAKRGMLLATVDCMVFLVAWLVLLCYLAIF